MVAFRANSSDGDEQSKGHHPASLFLVTCRANKVYIGILRTFRQCGPSSFEQVASTRWCGTLQLVAPLDFT